MKEKIASQTNAEVKFQLLTYAGKELLNSKTLADYHVDEDSVIKCSYSGDLTSNLASNTSNIV